MVQFASFYSYIGECMKPLILFVILSLLSVFNYACTIFILTDSKNTLFFNNEDYSNPVTRIWFIPGGKDYYGAAYVGFDNDWAQGGVNAAGLAFDWVSGFETNYLPGQELRQVRGNNPSQRMMESCATVEEAIAFYLTHKEPAFSYARLMIADKSGASVIISGQQGKLHFDKSHESRGFGYGEKALIPLLEKNPAPTVQNGLPILNACSQKGQFATKYSSIYNLRSGNIVLIPAGQQKEIKINLFKELKKGGHYYNMTDMQQKGPAPFLTLRPNMRRFLAEGYLPIANADTVINNRLILLFENTARGNFNEEDYSPELWKQFSANLKTLEEETKKLGKIQSLLLVERNESADQKTYLYLIEFASMTILQRFALNRANKVSGLQPEGWEFKAQ